jgi:aspartyl/asparaginyl beta-hydroxylase (cupin superfamily)
MFLDPAAFPWTRALEQAFPLVRKEFEALDRRRLVLWPERGVYNHGWEVFGLYAFGRRVDDNCDACPRLATLLGAVPGLTTAGFSVLAPGTVIKPHRGFTSSVLRCHLGVSVPGYCGLRVGEEIRLWEQGRCLVFDDTVEHEAWNLGDAPRVVLLLDFVRPGAVFEADFPGRQALLAYFGVR